MSMTLPIVSTCSVSGCGYNHDHDCHAGAITVTAAAGACGTYVDLDAKGGVTGSTATVGACHRTDCVHNEALECGAANVTVGAGQDPADCLTFSAA